MLRASLCLVAAVAVAVAAATAAAAAFLQQQMRAAEDADVVQQARGQQIHRF